MQLNDTEIQILKRAGRLIGCEIYPIHRAQRGYTPAFRAVCESEKGRVFVKAGVTPLTADFVRREISIFERMSFDFMPNVVAMDATSEIPILVIEDLSDASWPPPWDDRLVGQVVETIHRMHTQSAAIETFHDTLGIGESNWEEVAADPAPFLNLGIVDSRWLESSLSALLEAESKCRVDGNELCHYDLRSDNICLTKSGVKFVDWNAACMADGSLDLGFMLPSLEFEGGPRPEAIMPGRPDVAARVAGFFAMRAGLDLIPDAPFVRKVQKEQLSTALPWVIRELELEPILPWKP